MRFIFGPSADAASGLLTLPWSVPLEDWEDERLARREYTLLRALAGLNIPAVEVVGIVADRGRDADAVLVTRFLSYATTYRALFSSARRGTATNRLLDALVELLVRLHLSGFWWGDCSLSNALFR